MRFALSLSLLIAIPALAAGPGTATGTLTANGKAAKLTHAYAVRRPDIFDKSKLVTYVMLADREVPAAALFDPAELAAYDEKQHLNDVTVTINDEKEVASITIDSPNLKIGHFSAGGKEKFDLTALDATHVAGHIYLEKPDTFFEDTYHYDVTFDAPFIAKPKEAAPDALKGTPLPAGGGDPGKAYLAYTKVIASGDLKALRKAIAAERAKDLDDPDFAKMFPLIQAMQPKNIKVTGGAVDGDTATLLATGRDGGQTSHGTITMVRQGGSWKLSKESWKTKSE